MLVTLIRDRECILSGFGSSTGATGSGQCLSSLPSLQCIVLSHLSILGIQTPLSHLKCPSVHALWSREMQGIRDYRSRSGICRLEVHDENQEETQTDQTLMRGILGLALGSVSNLHHGATCFSSFFLHLIKRTKRIFVNGFYNYSPEIRRWTGM